MIYDCFTFFNELDLLEIRLSELSNVVDKFVIVESNMTFNGNSKPYNFEKNINRYKKYIEQIIYVKVDNLDKSPLANTLDYLELETFQKKNIGTWSKEIYQRNSILEGLKKCTKDDIILISDVDEIPNNKVIKKLQIKNNEIYALEQSNHYYYINCKSDIKWYGTKILRYTKDLIPQKVRSYQANAIIKNGGWHFSFLGDAKIILSKLKSFSHQEYNIEDYNKINKIRLNINNALDIFERPFKYKYESLNTNYPKSILKNRRKYQKYIKKNINSPKNTLMLRELLFVARSNLYWKNLEVEMLKTKLTEYQIRYKQAIKFNPLMYIYNKFITKV